MRFCFYVSGHATRVRKILGDARFSAYCNDLQFVFTDHPQTPHLEMLEQHTTVLKCDYHSLPKPQNRSLSLNLLQAFKSYQIDYCFCFGDHLLTVELIREYKNRIINFHPSLLPLYPGRRAVDAALKDNFPFLGNTAHFIDEGIDTGPIILQSISHATALGTPPNIEKHLDVQIDMFFTIIEWLKEERIQITPKGCAINDARASTQFAYLYPSSI